MKVFFEGFGSFKEPEGKVSVDIDSLAIFVSDQFKQGAEMVTVTYEDGSVRWSKF